MKFILLFCVFIPCLAFAQERPPVISYQGRLSDGDSDTTGINEDRLNLMVPLMKFEDGFLFMPLTYSRLRIRDQLKLDTGTAVPQDFTSIEGVLQFIKNYADESNIGFRGSFGYAGDKTLGATNDNTFSLGAHYSFLDSDKDRWTLSVHLTNNGPIAYIPIPGFMYQYKTETVQAQFGLPFMNIQWKPNDLWTTTYQMIILNINLETAYALTDNFSLLAGVYSNQQTYIVNERVDDKDRLSFVEDRVGLGLRFGKTLRSEVMFGYAFNRSIYVGQGFMNRDRGLASLDSDNFLSWNVKLFF